MSGSDSNLKSLNNVQEQQNGNYKIGKEDLSANRLIACQPLTTPGPDSGGRSRAGPHFAAVPHDELLSWTTQWVSRFD
jgi:hypothetical protein